MVDIWKIIFAHFLRITDVSDCYTILYIIYIYMQYLSYFALISLFECILLVVYCSLTLLCEQFRIKVLSMYFLKLSASDNNEPTKGDTPIIKNGSASGGPNTVGIWYLCYISLIKVIFR